MTAGDPLPQRCPRCNLGEMKQIRTVDVAVTKDDDVDKHDTQPQWQCDRCGHSQIGKLTQDV